MIVAGDLEHAYAIAKSARCIFNPVVDRVIANVNGDKLLGGVIFQDYNIASISVHAGSFSPYWFNQDMLWITFNYPFEQLKVSKLLVQVPSSNLQSLAFCLKLGFKQEAIVKDIFPDGDLLVLTMRREDCRWLKLKPRGA